MGFQTVAVLLSPFGPARVVGKLAVCMGLRISGILRLGSLDCRLSDWKSRQEFLVDCALTSTAGEGG